MLYSSFSGTDGGADALTEGALLLGCLGSVRNQLKLI